MSEPVSTSEPRPNRHDFAGFYRATVAPLRRYLARLTGNRTEAQDLAHDAYARVYPAMRDGQVETPQAFLYTTARRLAINQLRHRERAQTQSVPDETLDTNAALQAFLYTTARRLAINQLRHRERAQTQSVPDETLDTNAALQPGVPQTVMARQELARLEHALAQLPPGCRAVLLLRKVEMLPHDEIARRLGVSRSNVEKQHVRALRLLRDILDAPTPASAGERGPAIRLSAGKSLP